MAPFGTLLERFGLTFDDLFLPFDGIIERLDLVYFGIFVQPFFLSCETITWILHAAAVPDGKKKKTLDVLWRFCVNIV